MGFGVGDPSGSGQEHHVAFGVGVVRRVLGDMGSPIGGGSVGFVAQFEFHRQATFPERHQLVFIREKRPRGSGSCRLRAVGREGRAPGRWSVAPASQGPPGATRPGFKVLW